AEAAREHAHCVGQWAPAPGIGNSQDAPGEFARLVFELRANAAHQGVGSSGGIGLGAERREYERTLRVYEGGAGPALGERAGEMRRSFGALSGGGGERAVLLDRIRKLRQQLALDEPPSPIGLGLAYGFLERQALLHDLLRRKRRV